MSSVKRILVADNDIGIVIFLQERLKDKRFHFILATSFNNVIDLLETENIFAAIVDFEMKDIKGIRVADYIIEKKIPVIATFNEMSNKQYNEVISYPVIDYVIKNNLAGKAYLSDLLHGLESFYNKRVLVCCNHKLSETSKSIIQIFRSLMFQPIITSSDTDALEILKNDESIKIAYIYSDLDNGDGLWLCREIQNHYFERDIILFAGAKSSKNSKKFAKLKGEFFKSGVTDFFSGVIDKERFNTHIMGMMKILKQKQRLDAYIETVNKYVLISITNQSGTIVYASDAFCKISGYKKEELIGRSHNIVRHPDMPLCIYKDLWKTIKSGKVWSGEIKNLKKNGNYYWVKVSIEPIYDDYRLLIGYQSIRFDVTDKKIIEELSIRDDLTGLYNRRKFNEILCYEFNQRERYKKNLSLIIIDFDYFKRVNDTYGHQVGDYVLIESTKIIQSCIRKSDSLFRWGGEEFSIICAHTNSTGVLNLAKKIRKEISRFKFNNIETQTVSLGVCIARDDDNIDSFIKRCDDSLYKAKSLGRNQVAML